MCVRIRVINSTIIISSTHFISKKSHLKERIAANATVITTHHIRKWERYVAFWLERVKGKMKGENHLAQFPRFNAMYFSKQLTFFYVWRWVWSLFYYYFFIGSFSSVFMRILVGKRRDFFNVEFLHISRVEIKRSDRKSRFMFGK